MTIKDATPLIDNKDLGVRLPLWPNNDHLVYQKGMFYLKTVWSCNEYCPTLDEMLSNSWEIIKTK